VRIATLHDSQVLVVHHVFRPDDTLQTLDVGSLLPVHATALGKVLLAHHPYVSAALARRELVAFTPATITDHAVLERELVRVRERGWGIEIGELFPRQTSIAAPIKDRQGLVVGAIGIFGAPDRMLNRRKPRGDLIGCVLDASRAVSQELGAIPW
jgi:DNA-binding IclR family transcriptional regulator